MDSQRPCKRQRLSPTPSPPADLEVSHETTTLATATRVLLVEAQALSHICRHYETDPYARTGLYTSVERIVASQKLGGKVIVCGVGKSGLVGRKTVATMKSMGIASSFMHAAEAAHGDLGDIRKNDVLLFISFSGKTSELLNLLPHLSPDISVIAMTSHSRPSDCPLLKEHDGTLLPSPLHEPEEVSFGICAPTTSTTVQIAIGDMLALTVAESIHMDQKGRVFRKNHPGGAIGAVTKAQADAEMEGCAGPPTPDALSSLGMLSPTISATSV
ncbi:hypothetical protein AAFC00_004285 [Neodothiora populina]|uniref:SIS domain-containing protein n=1 Tax=Neodothiora populina TaxID=2781224 RepID=A0ABR3PJ69_9PEZI